MTIKYHGIPLSPKEMLFDLAGRNVCISYATYRAGQLDISLSVMQSIMFDNGAFSMREAGEAFDPQGFYGWVAPYLFHPHWAVVPDAIGGTVDDQRELVAGWPFPKAFGAPVWHLHLPLEYLLELVKQWPRVCLGSSADYWQIGGRKWNARMREVFDYLRDNLGYIPNLHGLRMMSQAGRWLLGSVDSTNVAVNYKRNLEMPRDMALRIERINPSQKDHLALNRLIVGEQSSSPLDLHECISSATHDAVDGELAV